MVVTEIVQTDAEILKEVIDDTVFKDIDQAKHEWVGKLWRNAIGNQAGGVTWQQRQEWLCRVVLGRDSQKLEWDYETLEDEDDTFARSVRRSMDTK